MVHRPLRTISELGDTGRHDQAVLRGIRAEDSRVSALVHGDHRSGLAALSEYAVIVGLQKPPPLTMRQQCWVSPSGLWHIKHAEHYIAFDRDKDGLAAISDFVVANR